MSIITLTSDYGTKDFFISAIKGAILTEFQNANIVDIYVLRNLRATTNETGQLIAANNQGFVPFDPKTQTFDYGSMRPGAFYYDPRIRAFVQRIPPSDKGTPGSEDEGGIFIYDKNTFKKRKFEQ